MRTKEQYIKEMHDKDRLVLVTDDNNIVKAMLGFSIVSNPMIKRDDVWSIPNEDMRGDYILIDRLITDRLTPIKCNLRMVIEYLKNRFPNKKVIWNTRRKNAEHEVFAENIIV